MASEDEDLILRDLLAVDRTVLANERTLLAYLRTMLGFMVAGGSAMHFIDTWWAIPLGAALMAVGMLLFLVGVWRYRRVRRDMIKLRSPEGPESS